MAFTLHELKEKTIQDLRDIAKGVENQEAVLGYTQMNKEHLLPVLARRSAFTSITMWSASTSRPSRRRCASSGSSATPRSKRTTTRSSAPCGVSCMG